MPGKPTSSPETRLARALITATKAVGEGANFQKAMEQIPEAYRFRVRVALADLAGQKIRTPVSPSIAITLSKEVKRLIESLGLEEGYVSALKTQEFFDLLRLGERPPDFGQVLKTFTPEMLAVAQTFQEPKLALTTKGRSFKDLVVAMDGHKTIQGQNGVDVDEFFSQHADQRPENWGAHIIEAPTEVGVQIQDEVDVQGFYCTDLTEALTEEEVQRFYKTGLTLKKRLKRFSAYKKATGVSGMDRWKYAHLMMQALIERKPIDSISFYTMLDEDPALSSSRVPLVYWSPVPAGLRVHFILGSSARRSDSVRFRRSVGGIVPNS